MLLHSRLLKRCSTTVVNIKPQKLFSQGLGRQFNSTTRPLWSPVRKFVTDYDKHWKYIAVMGLGLGVGYVVIQQFDDKNRKQNNNRHSSGYFSDMFSNIPLVIGGIIVLNSVVFLAWRVPNFQAFLQKHFLSVTYNVFEHRMYHTLLTSTFSHTGGMHLFFNMFALASIGPMVYDVLGPWQFLTLYLCGGVLGGLFSGVTKMLLFRYLRFLSRDRAQTLFLTPSLGASGAVLSVFGVNCLLRPDVQYNIMFIPIPIPAHQLLPGILIFDSIGFVYSLFAHSPLGHGAHIGGVLFGLAFYKYYLSNFNSTVKRVEEIRSQQASWRRRSG